jgi:acylphosphatase
MTSYTAHVIIEGRVQGVGFRNWTQREAAKRGLNGWVRNRADGTVEAVFQGANAQVDAMLTACSNGPMLAKVTRMVHVKAEHEPFSHFAVHETA